MTYDSVKLRIKHENWIRTNTDFSLTNYWHAGAKNVNKECNETYKSTKKIYYPYRPCGNYVIKVSVRQADQKQWTFDSYYCYLSKKKFDHQPNLNKRTMELETPNVDGTLPEEFLEDNTSQRPTKTHSGMDVDDNETQNGYN